MAMYDDGEHNDSLANDGIYGASHIIDNATFQYYIYADNNDIATFLPARAEYEFFSIAIQDIEAPQVGDIVINEFMVKNKAYILNEYNEFADWIELYNTSDKTLDLSNMYLSNTDEDLQMSQITKNTALLPHSYLIIWCDKKASTSLYNHADFKLSQGGKIILANNANVVFDSTSYDTITKNITYARIPNGSGEFVLSRATFGYTNNPTYSTDVTNVESNTQTLTVYPNPANAQVTVVPTDDKRSVCKIFTAKGELVFMKTIQGNTTIPTSQLTNGTYFLMVNQILQTIVVQH